MEDPNRLRVYQCAEVYARNVHRAVRGFPRHLLATLVAQLEDAAESIGSNIAEGCGRKNSNHGNAELIRYLHFAVSSANESRHRARGGYYRGYIPKPLYWRLDAQIVLIKKMLARLIKRLDEDDRGRRS